MRVIDLTQGYTALIDDEDFDEVSKHFWQVQEGRNTFYASTKIKERKVFLHRFVMSIDDEQIVDHKDDNGLNCCKDNLRVITNQQNLARRVGGYSSSGYRGVHERAGRFSVKLGYAGQQINGGTFATAEEAARRYDELALQYNGEFAVLNFPDQELVNG